MRATPQPLESLRILVSCVRHENFSRAAEEVGITPAAVSQRMRALEAQLGVKLFGRNGPKLVSSDRARALARRLEQAFSLLRTAVDECRRTRRVLRVTCAPTFAARWLVPRLASYQSLPGADAIVLDAAQQLSRAGSFDVAVRSGSGPWPPYEAALLLMELGTPMLDPKWLSGKGRPTARKLLKIPLIPDPRWPAWFKLAGLSNAKAHFVGTRFPNYELEAQAAARGIGAALLSPLLFEEFTAQGKLVAPFPWSVEGPNGYWLLLTKDSREAHFVRWLKSQFGI
jgi:LysR family transcriptional regulator, glycine cleavage system transcriptional activator